jgi:predicted AAA+ superfamily ATPase
MFKRAIYPILLKRLKESRRFIQVLSGPRQVGKTTLIRQVMEAVSDRVWYSSADEAGSKDTIWIQQQWDLARLNTKKNTEGILILDEVQKIPDWSSTVKKCWDEDTHAKTPLKIVLLGSAPLLIQQGLTESLAGRFEQIPITHWTYPEMRDAFGWTLEQFIYFGGYPGSAELIQDETRWKRYIQDSLIETTLSRDILLLNRIQKPALLRRLFQLACEYSGRELSYQKMLGQLHDAGNTTTLAHYLELLKGIGMVAGIEKYVGKQIRQRSSSPKLQVFNTALISAFSHYSFDQAQQDREYWGRLVESAVGAYLLNTSMSDTIQTFYWRDGHQEVDFVLQSGKKIIPVEVKSFYHKEKHPGTEQFCKKYKVFRTLLVGGQGLSIEKFLSEPVNEWIND